MYRGIICSIVGILKNKKRKFVFSWKSNKKIVFEIGGCKMNHYEIHTHGEKTEALVTFHSSWQFSEKETVFVHLKSGKRSFAINQVTHDVDENGKHITRLSCQEKKIYV